MSFMTLLPNEPPKMRRRRVVECGKGGENDKDEVEGAAADGEEEEIKTHECPARGLGAVPCTTGCDHVMVVRLSTYKSLKNTSPCPPNTMIASVPTSVAEWPARGSGGEPCVMGCDHVSVSVEI